MVTDLGLSKTKRTFPQSIRVKFLCARPRKVSIRTGLRGGRPSIKVTGWEADSISVGSAGASRVGHAGSDCEPGQQTEIAMRGPLLRDSPRASTREQASTARIAA